MKDRKIASVQRLIDTRAYTELYNQSRLTTDTGMAARLRLVCAAIDATAVFGGREPCKEVPSSVNAFVQAAHEMLEKPELAAWVLGGVE